MEPVLVIGAGPSGLAATRALVRDGLPVETVERHADVGGIWDIDNPGTPMYETVHLLSSRTLSALDGLPMPGDYPDYPSHRLLLDYLRDFADQFGLRDHIRFGVAVDDLTSRPGGGWTAALSDGTTRRYGAAVLAVGNQWHPNLPAYPGTWDGDAYHSRHYHGPAELEGKRVLVVGGGNSGCDIACDAARRARFAAISLRRGYRFVPKYLLGRPTDVVAARSAHVPPAVQQRIFDVLLDRIVGDVTRFGLPAPDHHTLGSHPILNTEILDHLGHGALAARPDVAELCGSRVRFTDGTLEPFDVIVWATGYRPWFPMLEDGVIDWHGWNPDLFLNLFHRRRDDLAVMGMIETDASAWPQISLQADLVAAWLTVRDRDAAQAAAFRRLRGTRPDLEGGLRHVDSPRHSYYQRNATYLALGREVLRQLRRGEVTGEAVRPGPTGAARRLLARLPRG